MSNRKIIHEKLRNYKKKFFINKLIKGVILLIAIFCAIYLIINVLEFSFRFNSIVRTVIFFLSLALIGVFTFRWIAWPVYQLLTLDKQLSDEEAANQIGNYFPDIQDKLINLLQLEKLTDSQNQLIAASIAQKTDGIKLVPFEKAVETKSNRKYLKYLLYPGIGILLILLFVPSLFTESTTRIINYEKEFVPEAPFAFNITNNKLEGFRNEDFTLNVSLSGQYIPEDLYISFGGRRIKAKRTDNPEQFTYTFKNLQNSVNFTLEAAGFKSDRNVITVSARPNLKEYFVSLDYPDYTGKKDETITNISNITVPEGTEATWNFGTANTEKVELLKEGQQIFTESSDNQLFKYTEKILQPAEMELKIYNEKSSNANKLLFRINTIKDEYPKINVNQLVDTLLYSYVILGGNVADDYGLNQLKLYYKIGDADKYTSKKLFLDKRQSSSSFYYQWNVDSLLLPDDATLRYYLE
ncbi:MAG: ATPase, partial [Cyclobacteriaceae bacterium]